MKFRSFIVSTQTHNTLCICYEIYNVLLSIVAVLKLATCIPEDGIYMPKHAGVMSVLSYEYTVMSVLPYAYTVIQCI